MTCRGLTSAFVFLLAAAPAVLSAPPRPCDAAPAPRLVAAKRQPEAAAPKLTGPETVAPYKLVRMKVENPPTAHFLFWDVFPMDAVDTATQSKKGAFEFVAPPGTYRVRLRIAKSPDAPPLDLWHTVTIGGTPPAPPNPPSPPNPPAPPDDKFGLVKASRDGFAKVTTGREKAAELAKAQRSHASAVAAGAFADDAAKVLAGWRDANKAVVSAADYAEWGRAVSAKLAELHAAGKLKTRAEWAEAFREVAAGLEGGN